MSAFCIEMKTIYNNDLPLLNSCDKALLCYY